MYTHTGDKPLTCKWCEERFAYASTLRSHRLRFHPDKMAAQGQDNYTNYTAHVMPEVRLEERSGCSKIQKIPGTLFVDSPNLYFYKLHKR